MSRQPEYGNLLGDVETVSSSDARTYSDLSGTPPRVQEARKTPVTRSSGITPVTSESPEIVEANQRQESKGPNHSEDTYDVRDYASFPGQNGKEWRPGVWRSFPHRGMWALLGCVAGVIASIIILIKSDGQPTNWTLSPTVYLALCTTLTNMLARFAFHDGVKLSWWRKALEGGTMNDLHARWSHADGFWSALFAGRQFNMVSLASLAVTLIVIDQPLIQRASTVVSVPRTTPINVTAPIAQEIPWGFTSYQNGRGDEQQIMSQPMIAALNDYNSQASITTGFTGCKDSCSGYVEAGGLAARCNSTTGPVSYLANATAGDAVSPFSVHFQMYTDVIDGPPQILVNIASSTYVNLTDSYCSAIRTERTCYLASATVRYPVTLTGNSISVGDVLANGTVQAFQPANPIGEATGDYSRYTIGGLFLAAQTLFESNATYNFGGGIGTYLTLPDTLSSQFLSLPKQNLDTLNSTDGLDYPLACQSSWTDPTYYVLSSLNTMAFMVSLSAASFPFRNTTVPPQAQFIGMVETSTINVYHSEYRYLIASVVLTMTFLALILPTFIGWWELGRNVTLNPIETAKAFDAPLLRGPGSNAPLGELVKVVGGKRIRWGEIDGYSMNPDGLSTPKRRLMFADSIEIVPPKKGVMYI